MKTSIVHSMLLYINRIQNFICELQRSQVILQEQIKSDKRRFDYSLNESALRIIDILDLINLVGSNQDLNVDINTKLIIKKIEKRLVDLLLNWGVEEITFTNGRLEPSKVRVIATQERSENVEAATIIEVCRKGYQRDGTTIRPADVITAINNKV